MTARNSLRRDVLFTVDYIKEHPYLWVNSNPVKKVEAIDDYTVKIYLNEPYAPFLDMIAGNSAHPPGAYLQRA